MKAELAGGETREKGLTEKRGAVTDAREELEHRIEQKTHSHMTVFEDIARCVDVGFSGPEAIQWSRLLYLPLPMMQEKDVSSNVKTWVQLSEFEAAIDEQIAKISRVAIKKCPMQRCKLSFIDEWSHRWDFHPDSSSHHWALRPEPFAILKKTSMTTKRRPWSRRYGYNKQRSKIKKSRGKQFIC